MSLIKVAALTPGLSNPVSRFRVRQYLEPLRVSGLEVTEYIPALGMYAPTPGCNPFAPMYWANPLRYLWPALKLAARLPGLVGSRKADLTWQVRTFLDGIPTLEGLLKRPLVFDVDDAIFLKAPWGPQAARSVAQRAEALIAGNKFLADWFSRFHNRVYIVATGVDTERFHPSPEPGPEPEPFVIGWTGTAVNLPYLEAIASPLERFLARYPKTTLLVVADAPPRLPSGVTHHLRYVPWSPQVEAPILRQLHVGLMPLPDNDWSRGKCSFKMIQYMATGVPVVVSPVGKNVEILAQGPMGLSAVREDDWYEALEFLYRHPGEARAMGRAGRDIAQHHYSNLVIAGQLAAIFRDLV